MDLSLSDDQASMLESLARFLEAESPMSVVRSAEPLGHSPQLWDKLEPLGLVPMSVPEEAGGGGATLLDVALVCEQLGRRLAPVPFIESVVTARALHRARSDLLDLMVVDHVIGGVALRPASEGVATMVPAGAVADIVIALDGSKLISVRGAADPSTGRRVLGALPLSDRSVLASDGLEIGELFDGDAARNEHRQAVMEWRALTSAALVGLAEGALALAVSYVKDRRQFGVPIGSFQSVSHRLVDCATSLEGARLISREAAWAIDADPARADMLVQMAFAFVAETAQHIAAEALHFHGGYGYMLEYDIQLYFSRAKAWPLVGGDPRHLYLSIADGVIDSADEEAPWISP